MHMLKHPRPQPSLVASGCGGFNHLVSVSIMNFIRFIFALAQVIKRAIKEIDRY